MGQLAFSLNWIHSKILSAATICIVELTKKAKIEFLLLDWIYHSIQIMKVINDVRVCTGKPLKKFNSGRYFHLRKF